MGGKRVKIVMYRPKDGGVKETYHPHLGKLEAFVKFELAEDEADAYIASGLLVDVNTLKQSSADFPADTEE